MANRYWVGGTGTWNTSSTTNWSASTGGASGASVPTAADSVFFDQASTYTVTMTGALACLDITVSSGTVTFATGTTPTLAVSGSMSLVAGTVWNSTGTITFLSTTTGKTITTNGTTLSGGVTLTGVGGEWSLGSSLTVSATQATTLTSGTLNLNGFNLTTGVFSSSNANTRSIVFGSNNIIINWSSAGGTVLQMSVATGFTYTGTGGFTTDASVTKTYTFGTTGGSTTNAPNLTWTGTGTQNATLTTGSWFNKLDFGTTAFVVPTTAIINASSLTLSTGGTFTNIATLNIVGTGTITPNGKNVAAFTVNHAGTTTFAGALGCTTYTQTAGDVDFATFNLTCSSTATYTAGTLSNISTITCTTWTCAGTFTMTNGTITPSTSFVVTGGFNYNGGTLSGVATFTQTSGNVSFGKAYSLNVTGAYTLTAGTLTLNGFDLTTGQFFSSNTNTRSIVFGTNNIIISTTTTGTVGLSMADATNFSVTATTGGFVTNASVIRTHSFGTTGGSATNSPNLTITTGASALTIAGGSYFNKLDFGTVSSSAINIAAGVNLNSLTLSGYYIGITFPVTMVGTGSIISNNKSVSAFTINNGSGTTTLTDSLSCATYTQTAGTINFATFNLTCSSTATYTAGTLSNIGNITCTSWTCAGTFTLSSGTITPSTSFIVTGAFNYNGGTVTTNTFTHTSGTVTLGQAYALTETGTYTLTAGTLNLNGYDLTTGIFSSSNANTRSIIFGTNNIILATTTAAAVNLAMGTATNFTYTGTGGFTAAANITRTFTFGLVTGLTTNSPNLTLTGSGTAVGTFTSGSSFNTLNFGTTAFAVPATSISTNNLILSTSGTYTGLSVNKFGTGTITPNGKQLAALTINMQTGSGTTTLAGALSCTTYTQTVGTIDFATFNLTCSSTATYTAGTLSNIGNISCTTWTVNTGATFTLTQGTITPSTSFIVLSATSTFNYNGGTITSVAFIQTAGTVTLGAALTLASNCTYTLTAGTLNLNGYDLTTGIFSSSNANTRSIIFGTNNIVLTTTTATANVLFMQTMTNFTYTGTGGFLADASVAKVFQTGNTGGATSANAPNLTFTGSGTAVQTISNPSWFNKLDFGSTAFTIGGTAVNVNSLTLSSGGTFTGVAVSTVGTGTITPNGKTISGFTINNGAGTTTLAAALSCSTYTQTAGTIDFATFNLTCSSTATYTAGTLNNIGTITCTTWTCAGTFTMTNGTITPSTSFVVTGGFNYNGGTLSPVPTFTHTSGTVTLGQAYALTATGTYGFAAGTINLNGFNLTTGIFNSGNTNTRSIAFGSNYIVLAHTTAGQTVLGMNTATNFTCTGTGGFTAAADITRTFQFGTSAGGSATNAPNLTWTGTGSAVQTLTTDSWFNILNFGTTAFNPGTTALNLNSLVLSSSGTYTGLTPTMRSTGSITSNGKSIAGLTIQNGVGTTTFIDQLTFATATATLTLASGNLDLSGFNLTVGIFSSNNSTTRSITFGSNNIILAHTTAATTVLSMATVTGFTWTGTGGFTAAADITRTFSFGSSAGGTNTNAPNITLTGSGTAVQTFTTAGWFNNLDFGTTAFAVPTTSINVSTLTLSSGGTYTGLQPILTRTQTWTSQFSKQLGGLGVNGPGVTLTLDNTQTYITNSEFSLLHGTLDLGGYDLTIGQFTGSVTNTRSILFGSNNIILNWSNAGANNLVVTNATNFTYTGTGGFVSDASITRTFVFGTTAGGTSTNSPNLTLTGSGTAVQTFSTGSTFNKLDFGTTSFTVFTTSLSVNSLTLSSGGTFTSLSVTTFGTGTITTNGKTINALTINCPNGTTTLAGALATGVIDTTTLTAGTLDLAGFILTTGNFSSNNTNTRSISFGSGSISLVHTTAGVTVLSMANATGFTLTGTGGFTAAASTTRTFVFGTTGGSRTNSPNLILTGSGTAVQTFTTGGWFNKLDFGTTAFNPGTTSLNLNSLTLSSTGTFTNLTANMVGTGIVIGNGNNTLGILTINTSGTTTLGSAVTLSATGVTNLLLGNLDLGGFTLTTGTFSGSNTGVRSILFGTSNIVLAHTTAATVVLSMADVTNFTYTGTGGFSSNMSVTRTFTFGTTGGSTTNAPNLALTAGASIPTLTTNSWFDVLDFTGSTCTPAAATINVDTLTLDTGGTYTNLIPQFTRTQTWTSQFSKQLGGIGVNGSGVTLTLDNTQTYTATSVCNLVAGTLNLGGYDLTIGTVSSSNTNTRAIEFGSNNIILSTTTAAATNLNMATATGFTYTGAGGFTAAADITRTFTFGTTGGSITNSPNLTFTGSGTAIQTLTTGSWFDTLSFGTTAFTLATTNLNLTNLILSSTGIFSLLTANMVDTGTVTSNTNASLIGLTINGTGITTSLSDQLIMPPASIFTLTNGTLNLNGYDLIIDRFVSSNTNTRSITFGSKSIYVGVSSAWTSAGIQYVEVEFTSVGTFTWTVPSGITSINAVLVGGRGNTGQGDSTKGGRGGGGLRYINNMSVTPGEVITVAVGGVSGTSSLTKGGNIYVQATGGANATNNGAGGSGTAFGAGPFGGTIGGGNGGTGGSAASATNGFGGGGGAGGYSGNGGNGGSQGQTTGAAGSGGGGGGGGGSNLVTVGAGSGGSVGIYGQGASGNAGAIFAAGGAGSGGGFGQNGGGNGNGAVRIISGFGRLFPTPGGSFVPSATPLSMADATNFTYTGTGTFITDASVAKTITFGTTGGSITNSPNLIYTESGTGIQTLTTGSWFNNLDFGTTAFTLTTTSLNLASLILSSTGTYTGLTATMVNTGTITPNGKTIGPLTINHSGTTTLAGALTTGVTNSTTLSAGTLDLAGFNLSTGALSSSNSNNRSIAFGIGSITLTHTTAGTTVLSMADATGFTYTGTPTITTTAAVTRTFSFGSTSGGSSSNALSLSLTSGASIPTFTSGSWFKTLSFTGTTSTPATTIVNVDTLTLATGGTYTGLAPVFTRTQTWTAQFSKQLNGIGVNGSGVTLTLDNTQTYTATSTCYLTQGTLDLGGVNLTIGSFDSNNTNTRALSFGSNNIILGTTTAGTTVINAPDITNFSYTGTGGFSTAMSVTRTFTYGSTAGGSASKAVNLSLTSGASIPTFTSGSWFKTLSFTGTTSTPATTIVNVDTLTLATGGTYTGLTPVFTRTQTWTPQFSKELGGIGVGQEGVTLTLEATQTYLGLSPLIVNAGTLNISTLDLYFYNFSSTGTGSRSITGTGTINISNNWTVTSGSGFTGSGYYIKMAKSTSKTFAGGGGTYGTLVQQTSSQLNITSSNTFEDIQVNNNMTSPSQQEYTTAGTYSWTAPTGVTSVSVVAVGGGSGGYWTTSGGSGGGGGGLGWKNDIPVTPGQTYTVVVGAGSSASSSSSSPGGNSYFINTSVVAGLGAGSATNPLGGVGGTYVGDGGGNGGNGGDRASTNLGGGGGGAGGYTGNGGNGAINAVTAGGNGTGGAGGGGSGTNGNGNGGGGGVGIYGQGSNGAGGSTGDSAAAAGQPGSSGSVGTSGNGGLYGGGGTGGDFSLTVGRGNGANGAVRIIWGSNRAFPSTNTGNL